MKNIVKQKKVMNPSFPHRPAKTTNEQKIYELVYEAKDLNLSYGKLVVKKEREQKNV